MQAAPRENWSFMGQDYGNERYLDGLGYKKFGQMFSSNTLKSSDIEKAMDNAFNRIRSMTFVSTSRTSEKSGPQIDPLMNKRMVDDEGC